MAAGHYAFQNHSSAFLQFSLPGVIPYIIIYENWVLNKIHRKEIKLTAVIYYLSYNDITVPWGSGFNRPSARMARQIHVTVPVQRSWALSKNWNAAALSRQLLRPDIYMSEIFLYF